MICDTLSRMSTTQIHQSEINQQPTIWTVSDALWKRLEPLLEIKRTRLKSGRPMQPNRAILNGLIHMVRSGGQWSTFPREFAAKSTAFDRFTTWVEQGSFQAAWTVLLEEYDSLIGIEWAWQSADGCAVKAPLGKKGITARRKTRAVTQQTAVSAVVNDMF